MVSPAIACPEDAKTAIATLREHLDLECTETDAHGRYVLDFEAMSAVVEAVDEIEEALDETQAGDDE